jgi:hypothetical protein
MKTKYILTITICLAAFFVAGTGRAMDITATNSGNWGDTNIWNSGTVPGTNDDADVPAGIDVLVDSNAIVQFIYDAGTVTMGPNATLTVVGDPLGADGTQNLGLLDASAPGNTVVYSGNAFWAKHQNYDNLVLSGSGTLYNGEIGQPGDGQVVMTIAGNLTLGGTAAVQEGDDIIVDGNLEVGTNSSWDCSSFNLTVVSNTTLDGVMQDFDGANGNDVFNSVTIDPTGVLHILDSTNWYVNGSLTNNGGKISGVAYASINFNGTGNITGTPITMPTFVINGTYTIGATVTLLTNTPTLSGTLVFDLAAPGEIILDTYPTNPLTLYYNSQLNVIDSGAPPVSGTTYQLFSAGSYGGAFSTVNLPTLSGGLSWVNNLATSGSIMVTGGGGGGKPAITTSISGGQLTLSWNSTTYPGYSVQSQTNKAGIGSTWSATSSGSVSPYIVTINPTNPPVFYRLMHP